MDAQVIDINAAAPEPPPVEQATPEPRSIMGMNDPRMTKELLETLLTKLNGPGATVKLPYALLMRVGQLCNPLVYRTLPNGELMAIVDAINAEIDRQVIEAQREG
jgi:hypothetical protein